jgi:CHAT domain-containing protein/Tfp pilus assembly protein PilF
MRVVLVDPSGQKLRETDCRLRTTTRISAIAAETGQHQLFITGIEKETAAGQYELRVASPRQSTAEDHDRVQAEIMMEEADRLASEGLATSSRAAIEKYRATITLVQALGDPREEGYAQKRIGDTFQTFSQFENALDSYQHALSAFRQSRDVRSQAAVRNAMAVVYLSLGENGKAREECRKAKNLSALSGSRDREAEALNNMGEVYNWSGDLQQAIKFYQRALSIWDELSDRRGQAQTHLYLGYTYSDLGQPRNAFTFFNRALGVWEAAADRHKEEVTLTALGRLYARIGESQQALNMFDRALPMARSVGDPIEEGRILNGMAYTYDQLGELRKAIEYYDSVVLIFRKAGYLKGAAATLYDAGRIYNALGQHQQALDCFEEALKTSQEYGDRRLVAFEIREIGRAYDSMGEKEKARKHYIQALAFWQTGKDFRPQAETLNWLGQVYSDRGESQLARSSFERALNLSRKAEYRFAEAASLYNLARLERSAGDLEVARARAEEALAVIESMRQRVNDQDLRTTYFASVLSHYELYIDILMRLDELHPLKGYVRSAFEASERARARSLLETLTAAHVSVRDSADPALLEQESQLNKMLDEKAQRQMHLRSTGKEKDPELLTLSKEIDDISWRLREVRTQLVSSGIERVIARAGQPLSASEIQKNVLDDDTMILEYMLGDRNSYVWVVSRNEIVGYKLPSREMIEEAVRKLRLSLSAKQPVSGETFQQRESRIAKADASISEVAAELGRTLLGPIANRLGSKRLIIVPDGALYYVPFQALMIAPAPTTTSEAVPQALLVVNHEIIYEPSASTLAALLAVRAQRRAGPFSVAVFANPVFEADDPRVGSAPLSRSGTIAEDQVPRVRQVFRDLGISDGPHIPALPGSRDEAEAIISVVPRRSGFSALGFEASRATISQTDLSKYRIVHFATHGFVDFEHPELSGLVLSMVDQQGQPQPGFFRMHDIYNLKLPVDLVVLSACNTGLGKEVKGEGLIGLTRGFMYAGANGVIASLWKVDDEATAELMKNFYAGLFQKGLTPAAALREAQLHMSQSKRWHSPYYWAAFVLQGQYDQKQVVPSSFPMSYMLVISTVSMMLVGALLALLKNRGVFFI